MNTARTLFMGLILASFFMSGCVMRRYVVEKPRTDTTVEGNRGYLFGTPKDDVSPQQKEIKNRLGENRKINVLEIEMPSSGKASKTTQGAVTCPDYTATAEPANKDANAVLFQEPASPVITHESFEDKAVKKGSETAVEARPVEYQEYKVEKGDTLQKISLKFYGTTKKWYKLFKLNKDLLKTPDRLRPGQTIQIFKPAK